MDFILINDYLLVKMMWNVIFNAHNLLSVIQQSQYIILIVILRATSLGEKSDNKDYIKFEEVIASHYGLNELFWYEMHLNPIYKRSLAFPYITQMVHCSETASKRLFSDIFRSNLTTSSVYNVHKRGH